MNNIKELEEKITAKLSKRQLNLWYVLTFLLLFSLFSIPLHFLIWLNIDTFYLEILTAKLVAFILNAGGVGVSSSENFIYTSAGSLEIIKDCLGWKSVLAFCALVFATRKVSVKKKIEALAFIPLILLLNVIRLVVTVSAVVIYKIDFELVHSFLWQWGLTLSILFFWFLWLRYISGIYQEKDLNYLNKILIWITKK